MMQDFLKYGIVISALAATGVAAYDVFTKKRTIYKGLHYAFPPILGASFKNTFAWRVNFNNSAIYNLQNENQWDINKLIGIRLHPFSNHTTSFRFGWLYNINTQKIDIYAYYYIKGNRNYELLTSISVNEDLWLKIECLEKGGVKLTANNISWSNIGESLTYRLKYFSGFYFGGNEVAPHTISVNIQRLSV